MRKERIKGLNRRVFRRNLKAILHPSIKKTVEGAGLENWIDDYLEHCYASGCWGFYEVASNEHKNGYAQEIKTN